jgi:hypothetical protein
VPDKHGRRDHLALLVATTDATAEWLHRRIREDWGFPDAPTEYVHAMDGPEDIVKSYEATGLRPFLDAPWGGGTRAVHGGAFGRDPPGLSRARLQAQFPFRRLFMVAYR